MPPCNLTRCGFDGIGSEPQLDIELIQTQMNSASGRRVGACNTLTLAVVMRLTTEESTSDVFSKQTLLIRTRILTLRRLEYVLTNGMVGWKEAQKLLRHR